MCNTFLKTFKSDLFTFFKWALINDFFKLGNPKWHCANHAKITNVIGLLSQCLKTPKNVSFLFRNFQTLSEPSRFFKRKDYYCDKCPLRRSHLSKSRCNSWCIVTPKIDKSFGWSSDSQLLLSASFDYSLPGQ